MQEDTHQRALEASQKLAEAQSQTATTMLQASQQQIQAAQDLAVNVATAATEKAVQTALQSLSEPYNACPDDNYLSLALFLYSLPWLSEPQVPAAGEATATLTTPIGNTAVDYKSDFEMCTTTFEPDRCVYLCVCMSVSYDVYVT